MTVIKEDVYTHGSLETRDTARHTETPGEPPGWVRRQKEKRGEHGFY